MNQSSRPHSTTLRTIASILLESFGIVVAIAALTFDIFTVDINTLRPGNTQLIVVGFGLAITLLAHFFAPRYPIRKAILSSEAPGFLVFCLSCILLIINISGQFITLRNPAVYQGITHKEKIRVPQYTLEEFTALMNRIEEIDEQYPAYVKRLTQLVFDSTVHYWPDDTSPSMVNYQVPLHENYLLFFLNKLNGEIEPYEFCRAERAVERCASVCSQSSRILANVLIRNRVRTQIVGLNGHVVVQARVNKETDEWWLLDPDYGVVIEHDLEQVERNPEIIIPAYQEKGYKDQVINKLVSIYGSNGNEIIDEKLGCEREEHLYLLKWLIPITGMLPFLMYLPVRFFQDRKPEKYEIDKNPPNN